VYEGLCLARQKGSMNVELQTDSIAVMKSLEGESIGSNRGMSLIRRIRCLLQEGWNDHIRHVYIARQVKWLMRWLR
jgi:ribonuclease HI